MLVSVAELTTYMDVKFTMRQVDAAEYVLKGLQSELEAYLRRPIEVASFIEEHILDSSFHGIPMSSFLTNQDTYRDGQNGEVANSAVDLQSVVVNESGLTEYQSRQNNARDGEVVPVFHAGLSFEKREPARVEEVLDRLRHRLLKPPPY